MALVSLAGHPLPSRCSFPLQPITPDPPLEKHLEWSFRISSRLLLLALSSPPEVAALEVPVLPVEGSQSRARPRRCSVPRIYSPSNLGSSCTESELVTFLVPETTAQLSRCMW